MTDQQTLHEYATNRDAKAFQQLVEQYQGMVHSAARRRLAHSHDVDDVVQLTFLKLARNCETIQGDLGAWLYVTTMNNANDLIRRDATRRRHESATPAPPEQDDGQSNVIEQEEWEKLSPIIDEAILEMSAAQRELIIQYFFRSRSLRDLAAEFQVSHPTIMRRLDAAVESLRKTLRTRGHLAAAPILIAGMQRIPQLPIPGPLAAQLAKIGLAGAGAGRIATVKAGKLALKMVILATLTLIVCGVAFLFFRNPPAMLSRVGVPAVVTTLGGVTLDDRFAIAGYASAFSGNMAADAAGNVYLGGYVGNGTLADSRGYIRQRRAGATSWTTLLDYPLPAEYTPPTSGQAIAFGATAVDKFGNLFVSGLLRGTRSGVTWNSGIILERAAGGSQFRMVDQLNNAHFYAMATDISGNLYAVVANYEGGTHWHLRRRLANQASFANLGDFYRTQSGYQFVPAGITSIDAGPAAGLYVYGSGGTSGQNWIMRKSGDGGVTWKVVEDFHFDVPYPESKTSPYGSMAQGADGALYLAGGAIVTSGDAQTHHWIVRKSPTGESGTWSVDLDLPQPSDGKPADSNAPPNEFAFDLGVDKRGDLYVVGQYTDETGISHVACYARRYDAQRRQYGPWAVRDDLAWPANVRSNGGRFGAASDGRAFFSFQLSDKEMKGTSVAIRGIPVPVTTETATTAPAR